MLHCNHCIMCNHFFELKLGGATCAPNTPILAEYKLHPCVVTLVLDWERDWDHMWINAMTTVSDGEAFKLYITCK